MDWYLVHLAYESVCKPTFILCWALLVTLLDRWRLGIGRLGVGTWAVVLLLGLNCQLVYVEWGSFLADFARPNHSQLLMCAFERLLVVLGHHRL